MPVQDRRLARENSHAVERRQYDLVNRVGRTSDSNVGLIFLDHRAAAKTLTIHWRMLSRNTSVDHTVLTAPPRDC